MNLVKPAAWSQTESRVDTFVPSSQEDVGCRLLRRKDQFPETYGFVTYVDPYVDFVTVNVLASDGTEESWTGTCRQYDDTWEPFLIKGAT
jgi:hypothetical protein